MKLLLPCLALVLAVPLHAEQGPTWIDPELAAKENPDFLVQGEYFKEGASHAVQVVALGDGVFEGCAYLGGLPGAGWNREPQSLKQTRKENHRHSRCSRRHCSSDKPNRPKWPFMGGQTGNRRYVEQVGKRGFR